MRQTKAIRALAAFVGAALLWAGPAAAQTVKVGFIGTYSGPGAPQGDQFDKGLKLFMKLNGDKLPPGVKVELIVRDDTGPNPDNGKRVAQELIVRDKVQFLTGVIWTPNARAIAPLTAEAKVPFISANAAGVDVPNLSPYFARVSLTLWQSSRGAESRPTTTRPPPIGPPTRPSSPPTRRSTARSSIPGSWSWAPMTPWRRSSTSFASRRARSIPTRPWRCSSSTRTRTAR